MSSAQRALRLTFAALAAGALVVTGSLSAAAVGGVRLDGSYTVTETVTALTNIVGASVGDTSTNHFQFTPECATGACATQLVRTHHDGVTTTTYLLQPTTDGYAATASSTTNSSDGTCYDADGTVRATGAYTNVDSITIIPDAPVAGSAQTFTGTIQVVGTPTPVGIANNCAASSETIALNGVSDTTPPPPTPPTTPAGITSVLPGGQFINVRLSSGPGEHCTAGFPVSTSSGRSWMLTARHCFGAASENVQRSDRTSDQDALSDVVASGIGCLPGALVACRTTAYVPIPPVTSGDKVSSLPSGDYVAFKLNSDVAAVPVVQTGKGPLPFLGTITPRIGDQICHYGQGSNGEHCGKLTIVDSNGWLGVATTAIGGDSGGPAYTYVLRSGHAIGVLAVGIVEASYYVDSKGRATGGMWVAPISTVIRDLGVSLDTVTSYRGTTTSR